MKQWMRGVATMGMVGLACMAWGEIVGTLDGYVVAAGSGRALIFSPTGEVVWEHKAGNIHSAALTRKGTIIFADGNITEVDRKHNVVWSYKPEVQKGGGAFSFERLPNGNTVIGENGSGRIVEVTPTGKTVVSFMTQFGKAGDHHHMRMMHKLPNGNYLVAHSGINTVKEYKKDGTVVWEQKAKGLAFDALRLKNGNTLISSLGQITEYKKDGTEVWEFKKSDAPDAAINNMCCMQLLPNGNIVVGTYANGKGTDAFEVTRDKKIVWRYISPKGRDNSMMSARKMPKSFTFTK